MRAAILSHEVIVMEGSALNENQRRGSLNDDLTYSLIFGVPAAVGRQRSIWSRRLGYQVRER